MNVRCNFILLHSTSVSERDPSLSASHISLDLLRSSGCDDQQQKQPWICSVNQSWTFLATMSDYSLFTHFFSQSSTVLFELILADLVCRAKSHLIAFFQIIFSFVSVRYQSDELVIVVVIWFYLFFFISLSLTKFTSVDRHFCRNREREF